MNQEKFVNSYIDLLNATITEAINKNLVIQAQKKVLEDELNEVKRKDDLIASLRDSHAKEINDLKTQLNDARKQKEISSNEASELKKSVQHVDTFKNELSKERTEKENLYKQLSNKNIEIDNLKKEISEKNSEVVSMKKEISEKNSEVVSMKKEIEELNLKLESKIAADFKVPVSKKAKTPSLSTFIFEEAVPLNTVKDAGKF